MTGAPAISQHDVLVLMRSGLAEVLEAELATVCGDEGVVHIRDCVALGGQAAPAPSTEACVPLGDLLAMTRCARCDPLPGAQFAAQSGQLVRLDFPMPRASGLGSALQLACRLQALLGHQEALEALALSAETSLAERFAPARVRVYTMVAEARRRLHRFRQTLSMIAAAGLVGEEEEEWAELPGPFSEAQVVAFDA